MVYRSSSSEDTKRFASSLAKKLINHKSKILNRQHALILALQGELGSGKTTFTQGFLRGLGIRRRTTSPTFILFRRFRIHPKRYTLNPTPHRNVYHVDAYRIKKPKELLALGFKEILTKPDNIVLIEWAENVEKILPKGTLRIKFNHEKNEKERRISAENKL